MSVILFGTILAAVAASVSCSTYADDAVIQTFQEYIRINTTTHNNLTPAVEFWKKLAEAENLTISVYEFEEGYPVILIPFEGSNSSLSSIMLNSHMDVVPAYEEDGWKFCPFSGEIDENGDIYGRGTQDMKSVSIQYFEAMKRLKVKQEKLLRTIILSLMPDEEVGGGRGMQRFLQSKQFAALNVGISMDEGVAAPLPIIGLFYQDKVVWQIQVDCYGEAAHGSSFLETNTTATGKCNNVINRLFKFRNEQYEIYKDANVINAGKYTSLNLNIINAGFANNVVPQQVTLVFDIRPATNLNQEAFFAQLEEWIAEAGDNITVTYISQNQQSPATVVNNTNPYWTAIEEAVDKLDIQVLPIVSPGSTDARFVRNLGIPAFGFSPMPNTPTLLHSVNERLNAKTFLEGISIYEEIISALANIPAEETSDERFDYVVRTAA